MNFIKEVQSLRGIAVLLVVFYHFNIMGFKGGFVGVDMFFVISGFIITGQIVYAMNNKTFSLKKFYLNRIKRLFPALFVVISVSFIIAFILYPPKELLRLSSSTLFSLFGLQNFFLVKQAGYFDVSAINKLFLHIWSLSIEEQFYIFWPFILLFINRLREKTIIVLVVLVIVLSIYTNIVFYKYTNILFYMLPFRAYEFLFGVLAFYTFTNISVNIKLTKKIIFEYFILFLLFYIIFVTVKFSLLYIIIIVSLTFLLLFVRNNIILSNTMLVFLGNISYSLYLIHWPVLVFYLFYNLKTLEELVFIEKLVLILFSVALSYLSYIYIENKFRKISFKLLRWKILTIIFLILTVFTFIITQSRGFPERFSFDVRKSLEYLSINYDEYTWKNFREFKEYSRYSFDTFNKPQVKYRGDFENTDKVKVLVVGDSQAADFVNILTQSNNKNYQLRTIPISAGCQSIILPLENYEEFVKENTKLRLVDIPYCQREHQYLRRSEVVKNADIIIIAAHYYPWATNFLDETLSFLIKINNNAKIYFLKLKNQRYKASSLITLKNKNINILSDKAKEVNSLMEKKLGAKNLISINNTFCNDKEECIIFTDDNYPLMYDKIHFTPEGARFIGESMEFNKLLDNRILKND